MNKLEREQERCGLYEKTVTDLQIQRMRIKREVQELGQAAVAMAQKCNQLMERIAVYEEEA